MIGIVGNNDRALSLALIAKKEGFDVTIFGEYEISQSLPNEVLRQSINWDLVTSLDRPKYDMWRMDYFLGSNRNYNSQSDIENTPFNTKKCWDAYIKQIRIQLEQMGVVFRDDKELIFFTFNHAVLGADREKVMYEHLVIAEEPSRKAEPLYLDPSIYHLLSPMIWTHTEPLKLLILPTDNEDYSMRAASYLQKEGNEVHYLFDQYRIFKHTDYDVPSFKELGYKSALGSFYNEFLKDKAGRISYLNKVNSFYSIRRSTIDEFRQSGVKLLNYNSINSVSAIKQAIVLENYHYIIDLRRPELDINLLKPNDCVREERDYPRYCLVTEGMRCPTGSLYVTGRLAEFFDGPRQRYISSAGITSKVIVEDIKKRMKS